jgi:hypothetical protein
VESYLEDSFHCSEVPENNGISSTAKSWSPEDEVLSAEAREAEEVFRSREELLSAEAM